jgi:hypothetical protein
MRLVAPAIYLIFDFEFDFAIKQNTGILSVLRSRIIYLTEELEPVLFFFICTIFIQMMGVSKTYLGLTV